MLKTIGNTKALGNVVIFASPKGGTGKSTSTVNLGRALQLQGLTTAIADIDHANRSSLEWANTWRKLNPDSKDRPPLPPINHFTEHVEQQINQMSMANDIVLIDAGAGNPRHNIEAIAKAALVIIPTAPGPLDIRSTLEMAAEMRHRALMNNGVPLCKILLNQIDLRKSSTKEAIRFFSDPTSNLPATPMSGAISASEALVNCPRFGVTIFDYPGASAQVQQSFIALAQEIMSILKIAGKK